MFKKTQAKHPFKCKSSFGHFLIINTFKKDLLELLHLLEIHSSSDHGAEDFPTLPCLLFI